MARLTESQRRRMRAEENRRRTYRLPPLSAEQMADYLGAVYDAATWDADCSGSSSSGGYDGGSSGSYDGGGFSGGDSYCASC